MNERMIAAPWGYDSVAAQYDAHARREAWCIRHCEMAVDSKGRVLCKCIGEPYNEDCRIND